jgi:lactoylglutathione lyase
VEKGSNEHVSFQYKKKVHIPPLNHFGLWVDDLQAAVQWMTARGA